MCLGFKVSALTKFYMEIQDRAYNDKARTGLSTGFTSLLYHDRPSRQGQQCEVLRLAE